MEIQQCFLTALYVSSIATQLHCGGVMNNEQGPVSGNAQICMCIPHPISNKVSLS